jgi:hypothetical protein
MSPAQRDSSDSNVLHRQTRLYSLAAAAAGVSLLALTQPAQGEVVVTRKTIAISPFDIAAGIDLNHDGITDFRFYNYSDFGSASLRVVGGSVVGTFYASALARRANVGPSAHFSSAQNPFVRIERGGLGDGGMFVGNWGGNPKNRYVGVRFLINGQTHYGWVRLTVNTSLETGITATITGYAYETVANKKITVGTAAASASAENAIAEPNGPSLGMLARGAESLPLWRRD